MSGALVTGGAGFIGSRLSERLLAEGRRVVALDDLSNGRIANLAEARTYGSRFTFYNMDVRAEGLAELLQRHRPEVVFHLAALPGARGLVDPRLEASVGVMGLLNVLEAATSAGARKVVLASSWSVYGRPRRLPVRESSAASARPLTPQGVSKKAAVDHLRFYQRTRGLDFTVLVPATVYGPVRGGLVPDGAVVGAFAARMVAGRRPVVHGDGEQTRDLVFIDDVVHAFALAAGSGSGALVNVGTAQETSVLRLFGMLADAIGFDQDPRFGPARDGEAPRCALDNSLAAKELGWRPWTHLEDGLAETIASIRESPP